MKKKAKLRDVCTEYRYLNRKTGRWWRSDGLTAPTFASAGMTNERIDVDAAIWEVIPCRVTALSPRIARSKKRTR